MAVPVSAQRAEKLASGGRARYYLPVHEPRRYQPLCTPFPFVVLTTAGRAAAVAEPNC